MRKSRNFLGKRLNRIAMTKEEARLTLQENLGYLTSVHHQRILDAIKVAIEVLSEFHFPSNLDEAAEDSWAKYEYRESPRGLYYTCYVDGFKAGAEWRDNQMKMPNSSELISAWHGVKSILQEKDFRGDEWRLAYNAFMFGFSKGLNTRTEKK